MKVIYEDTVYDKINDEIAIAHNAGKKVAEIHLNQAEFDQLVQEPNLNREAETHNVPEWFDFRFPLWFRDYCWIRCPRT